MPYYTFRISASKQFEHLGTCVRYREAKDEIKQLRNADSMHQYRMVYARTPEEGIQLLSIPRDERVIGED